MFGGKNKREIQISWETEKRDGDSKQGQRNTKKNEKEPRMRDLVS